MIVFLAYMTELETSSFVNFEFLNFEDILIIIINDGMVDGNDDESRVQRKCDE